jgi:hypothetical protein
MIRPSRLFVLKQWYPNDIRNKNDWVHKKCLASLGLYPFPNKEIPLAAVIGENVTKRIQELAAEHPDIKAPRELIHRVSTRLLQEFTVPTENGRAQLQWMISHWVTKNLSAGRGGVSVTNDMTTSTSAILEVELPEGLFSGVEECTATATGGLNPSADGTFESIGIGNIATLFQLPTERLVEVRGCMKEIGTFIQANANAYVARGEIDIRKKELEIKEKELELQRLQFISRRQTREKHEGGTLSPRRKKSSCGLVATLLRSGRYSISAAVLNQLREDAVTRGVDEPTPEIVYPIIEAWFRHRKDRVGVCHIDVRIAVNEALLPEVFGWPTEHRRGRFENTRHSEQLYQHIREAVWPPVVPIEPPSSSVSTDASSSVGPVSASSERRPLWTDHMSSFRKPVDQSQQQRDIERLCGATGIAYDEWPARPTEDTPLSAEVMQRWQRLPPTRKFKVHQLLSTLGSTPPACVNSYLLVALASKLEGWNFMVGDGGYPKQAVTCLRRVLLIIRHLDQVPSVVSRIRCALGCAR